MTLSDLYKRAEAERIEIDDFRMREVVAVSFPENWIAIDKKKIRTRKEEKVILAHELGHCETGSFYDPQSSCFTRQKHENRANARAYEMLIPYAELQRAVKSGNTETWQLAEYFDVPCRFMREAMEYWAGKC